jgi:hypothetical protein
MEEDDDDDDDDDVLDVAGRWKETVTKIIIKLITVQHLQGSSYTFLPYETVML